jgi:hypothetical protein
MSKISRWIYNKLLPIYIPRRNAYIGGHCLAIWCCIDCRNSGKLWKVLKGMRITIRKNGSVVLVIKKGEVL